MNTSDTPCHVFDWGPCVGRLKISDEFHQKLVEESRASRTEEQLYSNKLAGIIKEEYFFRDKKIFLPYLAPLLGVYDEAVRNRYHDAEKRRKNPPEYFLTSLWVNFQKRHEFNPPHDHSGTLSFVIFLQIPPEITAEQKSFAGQGTVPGALQFLYGEGNEQSINLHLIPPREKDLFIFPSWVKHYVAPFYSDVTRISVSGNLTDSVPVNKFNEFQKRQKEEKINRHG